MLAFPTSRLSAALFGLYLAQAVPLYLVAAALPPILRANGVGLDTIGGLGVLLAPWVFKALWAPWIDRLCHAKRVGTRTVVATCLTITVAGILVLSNLDPVSDATIFFPILMTMSISSATQDIASDGWAVEHLPPAQQPGGNALQGAAVALGVLSGGAGTLFLYDAVGWQFALWLMSAATILFVVPFLLLPGRYGRRPLPSDRGQPSLRRFFAIRNAGTMLAFALIIRLPEGLVKALEQPFLVDQGFTLSEIGAISGGATAAVGLFGAAAGALLIRKAGLIAFFIFLIVGRTAAFTFFFIAATQGLGAWAIVALSVFDTFFRYIEIVGLYTAFMRFSSLQQAGTDFTVLTSATLFMYMVGGVVAGMFAEAMGYGPVFLTAALLSGLTGWIAVVLLPSTVRSGTQHRTMEIS
ncbi:MFS transporter [Pontivivens ytuae]|uniref:MFS transporter n=1 Tax=Pontivivens ytuae TaxID=2789856 RepID=A0A7S9LUW7_9RHOB|nr:MFS transporter [Pontivivens ytuae]QPH55603.1 MFS transporter [Pontivivens ytuae]